MNILLALIIPVFLIVYLLNDQLINIRNLLKDYRGWLPILAGMLLSFIAGGYMPGGFIELGFFLGVTGLFVSSYRLFGTKDTGRTSDTAFLFLLLNRLWAGMVTGVCARLLVETFAAGTGLPVIYYAIPAIALPFSLLLVKKTADFQNTFRILSGSLLIFVIPPVYMLVSGFSHDLIHEIIHLNYATFMFPDHPFLEPEFYQTAIRTIYNPAVTSFSTTVFFIFIGIATMIRLYWKRDPMPPDAQSFEIRKHQTALRKKWRYELLLVVIISFSFFLLAAGNLNTKSEFIPYYTPVQPESGYISIVTSQPLHQIQNGEIKKYKYNWQGKEINFFLYRWRDKIKVSMDFCEFCKGEEEGYVMKDGLVVCRICKTPISPQTVGTPGGCNPVPVKAKISSYTVKISTKHLVEAYKAKKGLK